VIVWIVWNIAIVILLTDLIPIFYMSTSVKQIGKTTGFAFVRILFVTYLGSGPSIVNNAFLGNIR
jgi:hypothetical protein